MENSNEKTQKQVETTNAQKPKEKQPHEKKNGTGIILKSKTTIGVVSVVASLLVATAIPILNGSFNNNVNVIRAKENISKGTKITPNMLKAVPVGKTNLPAGVFINGVNGGEVIGKYAATTITQDDDITSSKVSSTDNTYNLKEGQMLITVPVASLFCGVAGKMQAGDIVSVYLQKSSLSAKNSDITIKPVLNPLELKYVKIFSVSDSSGKDTNTDEVQDTTDSNSKPGTISMATFIVNDRQAKMLVGLDGTNIHFTLCCRNNRKLEKLLLAHEDTYLARSNNQIAPISKKKAKKLGKLLIAEANKYVGPQSKQAVLQSKQAVSSNKQAVSSNKQAAPTSKQTTPKPKAK